MASSTENLSSEPSRGGRPVGARSTESSTLVARVRAALGEPQEDFARRIGVRERTVRNYEKNSTIPKLGLVRAAVEQLASDHGITFNNDSNNSASNGVKEGSSS